MRYLRGEVVAALAGGGAEREVAAEAALHGVLEVGPVAEVLTDEGEVACPVAGGAGRALGVHEIGILGAGQDVHRLGQPRSEEHPSELQSLMRLSSTVFCLTKNNTNLI